MRKRIIDEINTVDSDSKNIVQRYCEIHPLYIPSYRFLCHTKSFIYDCGEVPINNGLEKSLVVSTGGCIPFSKKLFVRSNGAITFCEKLGDESFGNVCEGKLQVEFSKLADKYNRLLEERSHNCTKCPIYKFCDTCIFSDLSAGEKCNDTQKKAESILSQVFSFLEEYPKSYCKILESTMS